MDGARKQLVSKPSVLRPAAVAALVVTSAALPLSLLSCRYDPVEQEIIDDLGPETGPANSKHRPGQPCLACHSAYAGATPAMAFGGTVYFIDKDNVLQPAPGVEVTVTDWAGVPKKKCSNAAGNFFLEKSNWKDAAFPLFVTNVGSKKMEGLIGRDASCGSCHKLPDKNGDPPHDPVSGANFDSAGAILVDEADTGQCPEGP